MLLNLVRKNISTILDNLKPSKLDAYQLTQDLLHQVNVATDLPYRKNYIGFYKLRLPTTEAYGKHFALLEKYKTRSSVTLREALLELQQITRRIESSFGSKLLATIDPNVPPLDSIVLGHLNIALPSYNHPDRFNECANKHEELVEKMRVLIQDDRFKTIKTAFGARYPTYRFTDTKILDLFLWQYRP